MVLLTLSLAGVGLAALTLLVAGSSRVDPAEVGPGVIVCENLEYGYQRTLPAGSHCTPRTEVEITSTTP